LANTRSGSCYTTRRAHIPAETLQALQSRDKCDMCGDKASKYKADSMVPVCQGGSNELSNLRPLCHSCHVAVTQRQREAMVLQSFFPLHSGAVPDDDEALRRSKAEADSLGK
jgi:hypothetical protein